MLRSDRLVDVGNCNREIATFRSCSTPSESSWCLQPARCRCSHGASSAEHPWPRGASCTVFTCCAVSTFYANFFKARGALLSSLVALRSCAPSTLCIELNPGISQLTHLNDSYGRVSRERRYCTCTCKAKGHIVLSANARGSHFILRPRYSCAKL